MRILTRTSRLFASLLLSKNNSRLFSLSSSSSAGNISPQNVLDFWFLPPSDPKFNAPRMEWYKGGPSFDKEIADKFSSLVDLALEGKLRSWEETIESKVALIIVIDQFPRNIFRGNAKSFAGNNIGISLSKSLLNNGDLYKLPLQQQLFSLLPLMHSENLEDQKLAVEAYDKVGDKMSLTFAQQHLDVILKYGRFPGRNEALGRESTEAEAAYLAGPRDF